jgi:hypothetical protein
MKLVHHSTIGKLLTDKNVASLIYEQEASLSYTQAVNKIVYIPCSSEPPNY